MKMFLFAMLVSTTAAFAGEALLLEVPARDLGKRYDQVGSKMYVDAKTGDAKAIITSYQSYEHCTWSTGGGEYPIPSRDCTTMTYEVESLEAQIPDISLVDKEVMYNGANGELNCGVIKRGRIFRGSTRLILNGNCMVEHRTVKVNGEKSYQLFLITK